MRAARNKAIKVPNIPIVLSTILLWVRNENNSPWLTLPIKKIIVRDVITDKPILKVIYLNTFKKEKVSIKEVKRLYSI